MSRYFFHLQEGADLLLDPEGRELSGLPEISRCALADARSIISHEALKGRITLDQQIDVHDAGGTIVHSIRFADAVEIVRTG